MHMLSFIFAVILVLLAITATILRKTYSMVPAHELKRQASGGNSLARELYRAVGYGSSLRVVLWIVTALGGAGGIVLFARVAPGWLGFILVAVTLWLAFSWLPNTRVTGVSTRLTLLATPAVVWLLNYLDPLLRKLSGPILRHHVPRHSGLYELQDLLNLLDLQANQPDSRITTEELALIRQVLQFGDRKVRDALRPRQQIKSVALNDAIGPILLDELHASGQSSFPVKKTARSKEIIGSLQLGDIGIHSKGTVENYYTTGVIYIHESDSLADALHVFYQTKRQLFIVINSFEEYVGVLTLEDIVHQLVGRPAENETLGGHDNSVVVAARHTQKVAPEAEVVAETAETVVE